MGARTRAVDWASTPVGPPERWSGSLRAVVSILLTSRHPMFLWWGPELVQFYNDAYRPSLGDDRHPAALGARGREFWSEIWAAISPQIDAVMTRGESTWNEDHLVPIARNGRLEEVYWTYGYSPVRNDDGTVGGTLVVVQEQTRRVVSERRLRTLRDMAALAAGGRTEAQSWAAALAALADNPRDVPWAVLYAVEDDGTRVRGLGHTCPDLAAGARLMHAGALDGGPWPLRRVLDGGSPVVLDDVRERVGDVAGPASPAPVERAWLAPIRRPGAAIPYGVLVAGTSPHLGLDAEYGNFLTLAVEQIATVIGNARTSEEERRRAESLAELDRAKTAFFPNVSHEFRTPLTLMLGPTEDAPRPRRTRRCDRDDLETVHRNALRLLKLVNTLLDFSRIEAGRAQAVYEPTDLAALTARPRERLPLGDRARRPDPRRRLRAAAEPVYVDRDMWEKIVLNLLSNALKFTFEGRIAVGRAAPRPTASELTVRDTGVGIPRDELPHVFERFHRVRRRASAHARGHRHRPRAGPGAGEAARRQRSASRAELGEGTTFTVTRPVRGGAPAARSDRQRAGARRAVSLRRTPYRRGGAVAGRPTTRRVEAVHAAGTVRHGEHRRATILLADDNADMRDYLGGCSGRTGASTRSTTAQAALDAARARAARPRPDRRDDAGARRLRAAAALRDGSADARTCPSSCCRRAPARRRASRGSRRRRRLPGQAVHRRASCSRASKRSCRRSRAHARRGSSEAERRRLYALFTQAPAAIASSAVPT